MKAMVLTRQEPPEDRKSPPLEVREIDTPKPGHDDVLVRVMACAVCRTDLHVIDNELPHASLPLVPGHEIVGEIEAVGANVESLAVGDRVGIPWLGWTCGECRYCRNGRENLCDEARFTGYQIDGGYAEYTVADARYAFRVSADADPVESAPLLCAGLIGYRSFRMAGEGRKLGFYGFGAAAHILTQVAVHLDRDVYAFTRPGDAAGQRFAKRVGAVWAGGSDEQPPCELDAAIIFAPVGDLVPTALRAVRKGGVVVCAGIHMSDIPSFPYRDLWEERTICSVANLTRTDGEQFMKVAVEADVKAHVERYTLEQANEALEDLRNGDLEGAAVLVMD